MGTLPSSLPRKSFRLISESTKSPPSFWTRAFRMWPPSMRTSWELVLKDMVRLLFGYYSCVGRTLDKTEYFPSQFVRCGEKSLNI